IRSLCWSTWLRGPSSAKWSGSGGATSSGWWRPSADAVGSALSESRLGNTCGECLGGQGRGIGVERNGTSGARAWTVQWAEVGWLGQSVHMNVSALSMELHIAASGSLKAKRAVIKHLIETSKVRFGVAAAEVDFHYQWQRTE